MATIHVERPITSEPATLLRKFEADVLTLPNFRMFVDRYEITDSTITFEGSKGVSGKVEAKPGLLIVDVVLGPMASLMRPLIESRLNELLSRLD
jgi:hypothetical protein